MEMLNGNSLPLMVGLIGGLIVVAFLLKAGLQRAGIPGMIGFLVLGLAISAGDARWHLLPGTGHDIMEFLGQIGLFALLFHVGLKSNYGALLDQLDRAAIIWIGNVVGSAAVSWIASRWILQFDLVPSLFVTVAMTATSVGVPLAVFEERDAVDTEGGQIFLDVAELDDISSVILMGLLFVAAPLLHASNGDSLIGVLGESALIFFLKLALFGGACMLFSAFVERPMTRFFERLEHGPDPMLSVVGVGVLIAALAGILGLSVAIGAFFAGLTFSRDPESVKIDASFESLYEFFVPFFFIHIGLMVDTSVIGSALGVGLVLVVAAALGKFFGGGATAWPSLGKAGALVIGVGLIPRAEVAMVVMQEGRKLGDWAVPPAVFSGMVLVSLVTCLTAPILLRFLIDQRAGARPAPEA